MKRLLALLVVFALVTPAPAHFIWFVPQKGLTFHVVFSDELGPDANVPITKITQTKIFGRSGDKELEPHSKQEKDHLNVHFHGKTPIEVGGTCLYGVAGKKGDPYLLNYYPKLMLGMPAKESPLGKGWSKLPLEIVPAKNAGSYMVLWQAKPLKEFEAHALLPGTKEFRELKADKDGVFTLGEVPANAKGLVGIRARHIEKKEGEHGGDKYKEVRHYATWVFELPVGK